MISNPRFRWSGDIAWPFTGDRRARVNYTKGGPDSLLWGRLPEGAPLLFETLDRFNGYGIWVEDVGPVSPDFDPPVVELWLRRSRPAFLSFSGFRTVEIYSNSVGWTPSGGVYAAHGEPEGYFTRTSLHSEARVTFEKDGAVMIIDDDAPRYGPAAKCSFIFSIDGA